MIILKKFEFRIDYPDTKAGRSAWNGKYGLNAYYSGKSHYKRSKDADYWHALTCAAIRKSERFPKMFDEPVIVEGYFNDNLDCDNHAAMLKMIIDGMKGLLIADDRRKFVQGAAMYFHDEPYILIRVRAVCKTHTGVIN